jgi:hypothetical protein
MRCQYIEVTKVLRLVNIILALFLIAGCKKEMTLKDQADFTLPLLEQNAIDKLAREKVFFGHMSVGYDILNGLEDLKVHNIQLRSIRIKGFTAPDEIDGPGIYHAAIGWNGFPNNKIDSFINMLKQDNLGNKIDIAFFKFCYVDFNRESNPEEIFDYYVKTMESLKKDFPNLKILHVTVPLHVHSWGLRSFVKNIIMGDLDNIKRNEFNKLLLKKYGTTDPIFDLGRVESTLPDGGSSGFNYNGQFYFSLSRSYTTDGGHLNVLGRLAAAKELLALLCRI